MAMRGGGKGCAVHQGCGAKPQKAALCRYIRCRQKCTPGQGAVGDLVGTMPVAHGGLAVERGLQPRDLREPMGVAIIGLAAQERIELRFAHQVGPYRGILRGGRDRAEGFLAGHALRTGPRHKSAEPGKRRDGGGIAGPIIALADIERVLHLVMGDLAGFERGGRTGGAGDTAFELDCIGHQKNPPLIGASVGRMVISGAPSLPFGPWGPTAPSGPGVPRSRTTTGPVASLTRRAKSSNAVTRIGTDAPTTSIVSPISKPSC